MKILILEDEILAAEKLKDMLMDIDKSFRIIAVLRSIESGTEWLKANEPPDLIVTDIQLLDGLCFEIFRKVPVDVPVIFTTAFDQYAIQAFDVYSIDYLLKPVQEEKLRLSIQKVRSRSSPTGSYDEILNYLRTSKTAYKTRFMVKIGQRIVAIPVEEIAYFFSESKLTYIVSTDGRRLPMDQTLEEVDKLLDPKVFFRINRQFIIRFNAIAEIHPYFKGRIKLKLKPDQAGDIVVSSEKSPDFKKWLDQ